MSGSFRRDPVSAEALSGFPLEIFKAVYAEMLRTTARPFPGDMVRAGALLCEEAGETIAEALEIERQPFDTRGALVRMREEAIQAASVAIKIALRAEHQIADFDSPRGA